MGGLWDAKKGLFDIWIVPKFWLDIERELRLSWPGREILKI